MIGSDSSFKLPSDTNKICLEMAHNLHSILGHPDSTVLEFAGWLISKLKHILDNSGSQHKINREKMWTQFHHLRTDTIFRQKWEKFLQNEKMLPEPAFYQHVTDKVFKKLIKQQWLVDDTSSTPEIEKRMSYEEENALRYIGGYIVHSLTTKVKKEGNRFLEEAIQTLKGDDSEDAEESEEWTGSVDRGGLVYINNATHQFLSALEYSLRKYLTVSNAHSMDDNFRTTLVDKISHDDDVTFHWMIASANIEEDIVDLLFDRIVKLYVTTRGFSFAASILELYKNEGKKSIQKKKTLRQTLL